MRIGIWGAGDIGTSLAYRLITTPYIAELRWINRSVAKAEARVIDLEQGLAFAPTCRSVRAFSQEAADYALVGIDALVLTVGESVLPGQTRAMTYPSNQSLFRRDILPKLQEFDGVILVVTNPVDLMARLVFKEARLPKGKVIGLGTLVETARLRAEIGQYLQPERAAREVRSYAVGTHDKNFVVAGEIGAGATLPKALLEASREAVVKAADRVKAAQQNLADKDKRSTLFPIIEGIITVLGAMFHDSRSILTVSVLDQKSPDSLFYSLPVTIGRQGVVHRHDDLLAEPQVAVGMELCKVAMRAMIHANPDRSKP